MQLSLTNPLTQLLLGCLLWLAATCVYAVSPVALIDNIDEPFDLNPFVETIEDPLQQYTLEDIQAGTYDDMWQRNTKPYFVGHNVRSKYWFRVTLDWQGQENQTSVLYIAGQFTLLWRIGVVLPTGEDNLTRRFETGFLAPYTTRDIASQQYGFTLPLRTDKPQTVLGWVSNTDAAFPTSLPLYLVSESGFDDLQEQMSLLLTAFYAAMGALWIYNLFLFITLRQSVYGLYILFLACAILMCATMDGSSARWLWPNSGEMNIRIGQSNGVIAMMVYLTFVMKALDGMTFRPLLKKFYHGLLGLACLILLHNLFANDFFLTSTIAQFYFGITVLMSLVLIITAVRAHHPTAGYLLLAEIAVQTGSTGFTLMFHGVLPMHPITFWGLHWGFLCEALLLSLALAARTRIAQQHAIDHLQRYENLYESSVQGLFQFNLLDGSLKCNDAFAKLFGFDSKEELMSQAIVGKKSHEFWTNPELVVPLFEKGYVSGFEIPITSEATQQEIWVSINMRLIYDNQQFPLFVDGAFNDINERKLKEREENKRAIAESANSAKSQFFASMSHELRTPLTSILGYSEAALGTTVSPEQKDVSLQTIHRGGQQLLQLINDILDLSKIEAQKLEVENLEVNVFEVLRDVQDNFSILAERKQIGFTIHYQLPLPEIISSDPTRLKQTLINICGNAIKFTEHGAVAIHVSANKEQQTMRFAIQDSGIGLRPDQVDKLFHAFTQADTSTTRNFGGTGLGLYLSKQIAEKLGGDITVDSVLGKGSTFTITVATGCLENIAWLDSLPEQFDKPVQSIDIPKLSGHILYAENDPQNQQLIATFVQQTGATVDVIGNGQKALALVQEKHYDLIFTDIRLPTLDGVEFTKTVLAGQPHTPIIAITATVTELEIDEFKMAGFKRVLRKPIERKMLFEAMTEYLPTQTANSHASFSGTITREAKIIRVLLAEDNLANQELITLYLKRAGAETTIVSDGVEALQAVGREDFDLILMDMNMPAMDGMTAVRYLRSKGFNNPIYALTANESKEAIDECKSAGCNGHLAKPLDVGNLNNIINRLSAS